MITRRNFLSRLGIGVATVAVAPKILAEAKNQCEATKVATTDMERVYTLISTKYCREGEIYIADDDVGKYPLGVALHDAKPGQWLDVQISGRTIMKVSAITE